MEQEPSVSDNFIGVNSGNRRLQKNMRRRRFGGWAYWMGGVATACSSFLVLGAATENTPDDLPVSGAATLVSPDKYSVYGEPLKLDPERQAARSRALADDSYLRSLGICATEMKAQLNFEKQQIQKDNKRGYLKEMVDATQLGLENAQESNLTDCASSPQDNQSVVVPGDNGQSVIIYRSDITYYKESSWCVDRQGVIAASKGQANANFASSGKLEWIEAGNLTFQECNPTLG